ncbi:MAG: hypothetical protein NZO58_00985 [Gemmataceae bacterium]|nr:hypothetical protein [Gemmataceae bacterium]
MTRRLATLRRRERLVALAWGAAQWLAVVMAALIAACCVDWWIDRQRDTPWPVRRLFFAWQLMLAAGAGLWFIARPLIRRLSDDELALWVEERHQDLAHRLITTVQLSRPGAQTDGMSAELIAVVRREAEQRAATLDFAAVADHTRLRRAGLLLLPVLAVAALSLGLAPQLTGVLLARQFLADWEIPRSVAIEAVALDAVLPADEKFVLAFRVRGAVLDPSWRGTVVVIPQGQPREEYPLDFARFDGSDAIFEARPTPTSRPFSYTARLRDGRLRRPGFVKMVPRPVVTEHQAWLQLPTYCGTRPDGSRYEVAQGRGDVVGIPGSAVRLIVHTQRPVRRAVVQLEQAAAGTEHDAPPAVSREVPLDLDADGTKAQGTFDLRPEETGYRIVVVDDHGFANVPAPRRTVRVVPEEPPQVVLLKEQFPPLGPLGPDEPWSDYEVDGLPVVPGEKLRVGYLAHGPYGLGRARFLYRIIRKAESGNEEVKEEPWRVLELPETEATPASGPFDPKRGVFVNSPADASVYFHAVPSPKPDQVLGRTLGGGRFDFSTKGIPDGKGGLVTLRVGDYFEFCVEVFADKDPASKRPSARSEIRTRPIISASDFGRWYVDALQEERRLRELAEKQGVVFGPK